MVKFCSYVLASFVGMRLIFKMRRSILILLYFLQPPKTRIPWKLNLQSVDQVTYVSYVNVEKIWHICASNLLADEPSAPCRSCSVRHFSSSSSWEGGKAKRTHWSWFSVGLLHSILLDNWPLHLPGLTHAVKIATLHQRTRPENVIVNNKWRMNFIIIFCCCSSFGY